MAERWRLALWSPSARRVAAKAACAVRRPPGIESLEDRCLLSVSGALADSRFLASLYSDFLNRSAAASEIAAWQAALGAGASHADIAQGFANSPEYRTDAISADYRAFLGRLPSPSEQPSWLEFLSGGKNENQLASQILASEEYFARDGGNPTAWLASLYRSVLGRGPDASGLAFWTQGLARGYSRIDIAQAFVTSAEASGQFVTGIYESFLGRQPQRDESATWVAHLTKDWGPADVKVAIAASDEYAAMADAGPGADDITDTGDNGGQASLLDDGSTSDLGTNAASSQAAPHFGPLTTQTVLANIGLTAGWATFGQVLPQGEAWGGLQLGNLTTQTDIKTTWSDGSIRFAVVTAHVPTSGTYSLTQADAPSGSFTAQVPTASVQFTFGSTTYTATLPRSMSNDTWLAGPLVQEARSTVTPVDGSGNSHPFLSVIFDYRAYNDGAGRFDVTVENTLDASAATVTTYDVSIVANGTTLYQHNDVTHYYLTRWRKVFGIGLTASSVTPDLTPFEAALALPRYLNMVRNTAQSITGPRFDILQGGSLNYYMPSHGMRPELAPYPAWTARYLAHEHQSQRAVVLANGDLAGSWPIHVREANGNLVSINGRPGFWFYSTDPSTGPKGSPLPDQPYAHSGPSDPVHQSPLVPDNAHVPSLAYVPYLLTGDQYYADEMKFWADFGLLSTNSDDRHGAQGILPQGNEVRADAWVLRNLVDTAAYLPDGDPMKAYFSTKIANNLDWLDNWANTKQTPLGPAWIRLQQAEGSVNRDRAWVKPQQYDFLAWSIQHANDQGFTGGQVMEDQIAQFTLSLFTDPAWVASDAGPYAIAVGLWTSNHHQYDRTVTTGHPTTDEAVQYFSTLADSYTHTFQGDPVAAGIRHPFAYWEGPNLRLVLMTAAQNGWTGAQAAYDYLTPFLTHRPNRVTAPDLVVRSGWAIAAAGET